MKTLNVLGLIIISHLLFVSLVDAQDTYTLQKALQKARTSNLTLKTEHFNIDKARADVTTAQLMFNPILNNQTLQLMSNRYYPADTRWYNARNRQVWWQLTKTFQLPSQRHYKIQVAEQALLLKRFTYDEEERNILFDTSNKWLAAMTAQKRVLSLRKAKANIDTLIRINKIRYENLAISQSDLLRTEILGSNYELLLGSALKESINSLEQLKLNLGVQDPIQIDMNDTVTVRTIPSLDSLLKYSLNNRTDIQEAKAALLLSESKQKLQHALAIPQPILGGIWNPQNTIPYLGFFGTVDVPIFNRNQGEILKSQMQKMQALQNTIALQALIEQEVQTSYKSFIVNRQILKEYDIILKEAESVLESVRYSYLRGGTTIIDFIEAQKSRLDTQRQYGAALRVYRQNYVELLYYTGLINNY